MYIKTGILKILLRENISKKIHRRIKFTWISKTAIITYILRNLDHGILVNGMRHKCFWGSGNVNAVSLGLRIQHIVYLLCNNASSCIIYFMHTFLYVHFTSMVIWMNINDLKLYMYVWICWTMENWQNPINQL